MPGGYSLYSDDRDDHPYPFYPEVNPPGIRCNLRVRRDFELSSV